jgi:predicted nucleic acid-binding protein
MINTNNLLIAGIVLANNEVFVTRDKKFAYLNEASIQIF